MEKLFETGKELNIKQLSQTLIPNDDHKVKEFNDIEPGNRVDNVLREVPAQDKDVLSENDLDDGKFVDPSKSAHRCGICQALFNSKSGLFRHRKNIHEGVRYSCDSCDYKATTTGHLKKHKESIHEGVRYSCDCCDYKATQISHLKTHKQAKHKDMN